MVYNSWESKGIPPNATVYPQEIAGLIFRDYQPPACPLTKPAIKALILGVNVALGGSP